MNKFSLTNENGVSQTPIIIGGTYYIQVECDDFNHIHNTNDFEKGFYGYYGIKFNDIYPHEIKNIMKIL